MRVYNKKKKKKKGKKKEGKKKKKGEVSVHSFILWLHASLVPSFCKTGNEASCTHQACFFVVCTYTGDTSKRVHRRYSVA